MATGQMVLATFLIATNKSTCETSAQNIIIKVNWQYCTIANKK